MKPPEFSALARIGLPASIRAGFQGTAQAFVQSLKTSQLLTLFTTPVVYLELDRLTRRRRRARMEAAAATQRSESL